MINAILIDPETRTITAVTYDTWEEIAPLIGCRTFTLVPLEHGEESVTLYADDEGLFVEGNVSFTIGANVDPVFGKALFLGTTIDGDAADSPLSVEELTELVSFDGQMFIGSVTPIAIAPTADYPLALKYETDEGWCFYRRCHSISGAFDAWVELEQSGIEFNAINLESR